MADEQLDPTTNPDMPDDPSRREFVAMSIAAGLAAAAGSAGAAELPVTETNVEIKMAEGVCDAAFIHPTTGSHPGVLIWPDAFGLRPSMRDIAKRIAAEGYSVLVPNPFYRLAKAPVIADPASFSFQNPADMAKLQPLMASATAQGNAEKDAAAYVAFLDAQPSVNKAKKIGTQGYCMGGPLVVRTAAALPDRIGAGASFPGGGLVTDAPTSPHLLAQKTMRGSRMPRTSCARRLPPQRCRPRSRSIPKRSTAGACPTCRSSRTGSRSTASPTPRKRGASWWRSTKQRSLRDRP
jgi:carboxymethylenebutenolidase